jgi:hypothetical protein
VQAGAYTRACATGNNSVIHLRPARRWCRTARDGEPPEELS